MSRSNFPRNWWLYVAVGLGGIAGCDQPGVMAPPAASEAGELLTDSTPLAPVTAPHAPVEPDPAIPIDWDSYSVLREMQASWQVAPASPTSAKKPN